MSVMWCRSCGIDIDGSPQACSTCRVPLDGEQMVESLVGLTFDVPGRLRVTKRLAICLAVDGDSAQLHVSPKEKDTFAVPVASLGEPKAATPAALSPAARLLHAARQPDGPIKSSWDRDALLARAGEMAAASLGTMRMVVDEAIRLGWADIVAWARLSDTEKAWRQAHHAAGAGDLDRLAAELARLPERGYHGRVDLVARHLPVVVGDPRYRSLIESWAAAGLPGADVLHRTLDDDPHAAARAGIELLATRDPGRAEAWTGACDAVESGAPTAPLRDACPAWDAAALVTAARAGTNLDGAFARIAPLALPLIDDLIDGGTLTAALPLQAVEGDKRAYLRARLRPHELDDATAVQLGHHTELARRFCRRRDRDRLAALPASPGVVHYQALLDVIEGRPPDPERLVPSATDLLLLADRASRALKDKGTNNLPGPVVADPTLWPLFEEPARSGQLSPDLDTRTSAPAFAQWCDLQRLVGLLWDERWLDAVSLGEKLTSGLDGERQEDEALNLTAYALARLDRGEEAIARLERAMAGAYTEALLVNLSVVASGAKPEVAAAHFARIVNEAPTRDLQVAALRRAVEVWERAADVPEFPPELVSPLQVVLSGDCTVEDYARFASLTAGVAPKTMLALPDPGGERGPVHRIQRARARFAEEPKFGLDDLAREFIAVHEQVGRPTWFDDEWISLRSAVSESVFVPFGEAVGSAVFIDQVHLNAPDLLTQHQRFLLLPQAGTHMSASFAKTDDVLSADAMKKFFYQPIEEFLAHRSQLDQGTVGFIAENFHRTLFVAAMNSIGTVRDAIADPYNNLVARLRWDGQNRYSIMEQMRTLLARATRQQEESDRALDRLRRLEVDTDKGRERTRALGSALSDWRDETIRLRANL
jgi:hypothetical protein